MHQVRRLDRPQHSQVFSTPARCDSSVFSTQDLPQLRFSARNPVVTRSLRILNSACPADQALFTVNE